MTNSGDGKSDETIYKKVAVVENFYNIIYNVHVEMDGRSGKHAGQKRTYRAVSNFFLCIIKCKFDVMKGKRVKMIMCNGKVGQEYRDMYMDKKLKIE